MSKQNTIGLLELLLCRGICGISLRPERLVVSYPLWGAGRQAKGGGCAYPFSQSKCVGELCTPMEQARRGIQFYRVSTPGWDEVKRNYKKVVPDGQASL